MQNGGITPHIFNPGTNGSQLGQLSASRPCRLTPRKNPPPVRNQQESQRAPHTVSKKKIPCLCQESRPRRRKLIRRVFIGPGTGWTVQGSNPGGVDIFRTCPDRSWGQPSLLYNGYRVSSPWVKRLGRGVDHPPPSRAKVKERVELYLYSPSGPSTSL